MAVIILSFVSAVFGGIYVFHCAGKKRLLGAFGAGMLALIGLSMAVLLWLFVL